LKTEAMLDRIQEKIPTLTEQEAIELAEQLYSLASDSRQHVINLWIKRSLKREAS